MNGLGWQQGPGIQLSGAVSHGVRDATPHPPLVSLGAYGPVSADCDLLDGLFLAARIESLRLCGVRFDEQFDFHLYDLDFCRQAKRAGLRLWTWPILVTHASGGAFCTPEWKAGARRYLDKWAAMPSFLRSGEKRIRRSYNQYDSEYQTSVEVGSG